MFLQRAVFALTLGPLALYLVYLGGWFYFVPLAIILILAALEYVQLTRRLGWETPAWILIPPIVASRRRRRIVERSPTAAERASLAEYWPGYARVPTALAPKLDALTAVFAAEKEFVGCDGLVVTPPMRLAIAAQASLLAVGREC